tara:strand:- start:1988 stop:4015 length:2028 start_codon:yes stop_codon:yes gene_type:complete
MIQEDIRVKEVRELFDRWQKARIDWDAAAREDIDFYLGNHFTAAEVDELDSRNQSSMPMDRLYSAIEQFKAIITSKTPKFSAVGREDSDNKQANVWRTILEYIWDISDGNEIFKQVVHDYAVTGLGYFYCYLDKDADYGRGEVKFTYVDPFRVYVDPNARHRYLDDASGMIVSTILTRQQLIDLYPQMSQPMNENSDKLLIDEIEALSGDEDYPNATNKTTMQSFTPDNSKDKDYGVDKYRLLEYYRKVRVPYYRVIDTRSGDERIMTQQDFAEMAQDKDFAKAIDRKLIDYVEITQPRVKLTCTVGQIVLYETICDTDIYPIVPVPNIWTNTPYPMSDVRKNKAFQRFLNKTVSLITSHAQASAGLKLLVPQGSVSDIEELERDWSNPNATIEYDPSFGEPHFPQPSPLSSSIMTLPKMIEGYIDLNIGIFEMMQGSTDAAPKTYSATMMMEDVGQRRSKSKLRDIEGSLKRLGQVAYNMAKQHYKFKKTFRIVQPNNDINEYTINKRLYDDKSQQLMAIENDVSVGQFDIRIIGNSTLPSNKWGEWQIYMEAYQAGLIDRVEALKKTEIFDKEGVLQRTDEVQRLQGMLQQAQEQLKKLSGDLQTQEREAVSSRKRTEVEKFKTRLKEQELEVKSNSKLSANKLANAVKLESEKLRMRSQSQLDKEKSQKGAK